MQERYEHLSDLVDDPSFRRWVFREDPEAIRQWDGWITAHPDRRPLIEAAAQIVRGIPAKPLPPEHVIMEQLWSRVAAQMDAASRPPLVSRQPARWRWLVAASIMLLLGSVGWWLWSPQAAPLVVATGYGETQAVTLPDGSQITLNAHSELRYAADWAGSEVREVWLEGEAYFSVEKSAEGLPFRVYSGEMTVEVLGTEFNVRQRGEAAEVTLEEGSVALSHRQAAEKVLLVPGEQATFSQAEARFQTRRIKTDRYTAWRNQLLVFEETPMTEVAARIEEIFGTPVVIRSASLKKRTLSGQISSADLAVMLRALSLTFQLEIQTQGDTIYLQAQP
jgi:transmembrane sensor